MDFEKLVGERRSIRGYKSDPIPRALIDEVIDIAKWAPSSMNTQPWHFHAVTGDPLERIREGNTERMMAGAAVDREVKMGHGYEGIHRDRQVEIAVQLFEAMGIERRDKERRQDWVMRGFRQFDQLGTTGPRIPGPDRRGHGRVLEVLRGPHRNPVGCAWRQLRR